MTEETAENDAGYFSNEAATFGDRLTAAREALGMSADDLARRIGVRLKTLRAWEDDLAEPRANRLQMLAGMLNVSMVWLMTGEGEGLPPPGEEDGPAEPDISAALADLRRLRAELRHLAEAVGRTEKRLRLAAARGRQ